MEKRGSQGSQAIPTRFMAAEPVERQERPNESGSQDLHEKEGMFTPGDFKHLKHSNRIEM